MTIQQRLIIPIILILSVTWIGAAYYTKKAAFKKSRDFLVEQTKAQAENWVQVLKQFDDKAVVIAGKPNEAIAAWRSESLIFSKGSTQLERPLTNKDYIQVVGADNWVMSDRCDIDVCVSVGTRDTDRKYAVRWLVVTIYLPLFVIFTFGVFAAIVAVKIAMRPLKVLASTVEQTPVDRLQPLPDDELNNELKPLVTALNGLMNNLKNQLNKERAFLNTCAHEIRTPIAGLKSQMQSLGDLPIDVQERLANVQYCADRTVRIANQFLALAKSKNRAALEQNIENFDICEVVRQLVAEIAHGHSKVNFEMLGDDALIVSADLFSIEVIIRNLLDNAISYGQPNSDEEPLVRILCENILGVVTVCVEDNGSGLTPEQMENVTNEFYRADTSNVDTGHKSKAIKPDGAGLGLSIVQSMTDLYNGTMKFSDSSLLGGLKVCVRLPNIIKIK